MKMRKAISSSLVILVAAVLWVFGADQLAAQARARCASWADRTVCWYGRLAWATGMLECYTKDSAGTAKLIVALWERTPQPDGQHRGAGMDIRPWSAPVYADRLRDLATGLETRTWTATTLYAVGQGDTLTFLRRTDRWAVRADCAPAGCTVALLGTPLVTPLLTPARLRQVAAVLVAAGQRDTTRPVVWDSLP